MIGKQEQIIEPKTVRLVASARLQPPSLDPLVDTDDEMDQLVSLELATHGRLEAKARGLPDLDPRELVFGVPNETFINAAFCYTRPGGNRFNGEGRGAWYASRKARTSLAEVSFHLTRALAETGLYENTTDYAELFADFIGNFQDLRAVNPTPDCLKENTDVAYPAGQQLAKDLMDENQVYGIVYPSVRHSGGVCLAALYPSVVQNVRQGGLWRLTWSGAPEPKIMQNPTA